MVLRHRVVARLGFASIILGFAVLAAPLQASETHFIHFGSVRALSDGAFALTFGNFEEGIRLTREGLTNPVRYRDRSAALSNLCAGFVGRADFERAIGYCDSAIELNEKNWQAYNNRAYAHYKLGHLDAARSDIDRGLKLKPTARQLRKIKRLIAKN